MGGVADEGEAGVDVAMRVHRPERIAPAATEQADLAEMAPFKLDEVREALTQLGVQGRLSCSWVPK